VRNPSVPRPRVARAHRLGGVAGELTTAAGGADFVPAIFADGFVTSEHGGGRPAAAARVLLVDFLLAQVGFEGRFAFRAWRNAGIS
jgi:hypothetical protein